MLLPVLWLSTLAHHTLTTHCGRSTAWAHPTPHTARRSSRAFELTLSTALPLPGMRSGPRVNMNKSRGTSYCPWCQDVQHGGDDGLIEHMRVKCPMRVKGTRILRSEFEAESSEEESD